MDGMIEQVRLRAYELWQANGMQGCDVAHWTAAETEVRARLMGAAPAKTKTAAKTAAPKAVRKIAAAPRKGAKKLAPAGIAATL